MAGCLGRAVMLAVPVSFFDFLQPGSCFCELGEATVSQRNRFLKHHRPSHNSLRGPSKWQSSQLLGYASTPTSQAWRSLAALPAGNEWQA